MLSAWTSGADRCRDKRRCPVATTGTNLTRAAAADALTNIAVPATVTFSTGPPPEQPASRPPSHTTPPRANAQQYSSPGRRATTSLPSGPARTMDPKQEVIKAGAVNALTAQLRSEDEAVVLECCEALCCLAACQAGREAAQAAGAGELLNAVVLRGRRRDVSERTARAAYAAMMRVL